MQRAVLLASPFKQQARLLSTGTGPIKHVTIIGSGAMGSGIAQVGFIQT